MVLRTNLCLRNLGEPFLEWIELIQRHCSINLWGVIPLDFLKFYILCALCMNQFWQQEHQHKWLIFILNFQHLSKKIRHQMWDILLTLNLPRVWGSSRARCPVRAWNPRSWWCSIPHSWHCLGTNPQQCRWNRGDSHLCTSHLSYSNYTTLRLMWVKQCQKAPLLEMASVQSISGDLGDCVFLF